MVDSQNCDSKKTLPTALRYFAFCIVLLWMASVLDVLLRLLLHQKYPFLYFAPPSLGFDYVAFVKRFAFIHSDGFFTFPDTPWFYPAPAIFLYYPFYYVIRFIGRVGSFTLYVAVCALLYLQALRMLQRALVDRGLKKAHAYLLLFVILLLGWPTYFAFQRGNIELLIWLATSGGVVLAIRKNYLPAALLLGFAGSIKLYPLLFFALFLRPRRFKEIAVGCGIFLLSTVLALYTLSPHLSYAFTQETVGVQQWTRLYAEKYDGVALGLDHSLFALFRQVTRHMAYIDVAYAMKIYLRCAAVVAVVLFFGRVIRLPRPNQVLFVAIATVLLPPASFDYTLLTMLIPWAWLALICVENAKAGRRALALEVSIVLFGVLLAPLSFLHAHGGEFFYFQGAVRAIILVALLVLACVAPLRETQLELA